MSVCSICGKVCKSAEGVRQHQRESDKCRGGVSAHDSQEVKRLHTKVQALVDEGKKLGTGGGSFEATQQNARDVDEAEAALKQARTDSKADKKAVKKLAHESMSAANWTAAVLSGEEARFARAEEGSVESQLAAQTVGFVSAADFREKREAIEREEATKREREAAAEVEAAAAAKRRRKERKLQAERTERRGLSFTEEDDET